MTFCSQKLIQWFKNDKRSFPWRETNDPYAIWISEVMLQQTLASVVVPYFLNWMHKFPTVKSLAQASLKEVIKAWEGLGYYSRARNLHDGAKIIVEQFQGIFPSHVEHLKKIKGMGPYTLGAVRSFAFHHKCAALDGNAIRVLTRYFGIEKNIDETSTKKKLWELAESILPIDEHWIFNEALIELGATTCKKKPNCKECPLLMNCQAYKKNLTHLIPIKNKLKAIVKLNRVAFIISNSQGAYLLRQCQGNEIMHGLHEFPYLQLESFQGKTYEELSEHFNNEFDYNISFRKILEPIKHSFTHFQVFLAGFVAKTMNKNPLNGYQWFLPEEIQKLALSSGHKKLWQQLIMVKN